jgi:hypothetical protein
LIDLNFTNNKIGNDFWFNVFDPNTSDNVIGNLFVGNIISSNFISNSLGNYSPFNEIDTNFQYNKIGDFFGNAGLGTQNIISNGFTNNNIGNYFGNDGTQTAGGNMITSAFTKNEILSTKVFNYDFTSATYVYDASMTKIIFDRQGGTPRLSFYDSTDVLTIVDITA